MFQQLRAQIVLWNLIPYTYISLQTSVALVPEALMLSSSPLGFQV